jgi:hypothetical protein
MIENKEKNVEKYTFTAPEPKYLKKKQQNDRRQRDGVK